MSTSKPLGLHNDGQKGLSTPMKPAEHLPLASPLASNFSPLASKSSSSVVNSPAKRRPSFSLSAVSQNMGTLNSGMPVWAPSPSKPSQLSLVPATPLSEGLQNIFPINTPNHIPAAPISTTNASAAARGGAFSDLLDATLPLSVGNSSATPFITQSKMTTPHLRVPFNVNTPFATSVKLPTHPAHHAHLNTSSSSLHPHSQQWMQARSTYSPFPHQTPLRYIHSAHPQRSANLLHSPLADTHASMPMPLADGQSSLRSSANAAMSASVDVLSTNDLHSDGSRSSITTVRDSGSLAAPSTPLHTLHASTLSFPAASARSLHSHRALQLDDPALTHTPLASSLPHTRTRHTAAVYTHTPAPGEQGRGERDGSFSKGGARGPDAGADGMTSSRASLFVTPLHPLHSLATTNQRLNPPHTTNTTHAFNHNQANNLTHNHGHTHNQGHGHRHAPGDVSAAGDAAGAAKPNPALAAVSGMSTTPGMRGSRPSSSSSTVSTTSTATSTTNTTGTGTGISVTAAAATTEEKPRGCHCKKSKCLKLYCECFARQGYCVGCNCNCCQNTPKFEEVRQKAIAATLERDPQAFFRATATAAATGDTTEDSVVRKGCHCKKSGCLKKYCECFQAGVPCTEFCRCLECKNGACGTHREEKDADSPLPVETEKIITRSTRSRLRGDDDHGKAIVAGNGSGSGDEDEEVVAPQMMRKLGMPLSMGMGVSAGASTGAGVVIEGVENTHASHHTISVHTAITTAAADAASHAGIASGGYLASAAAGTSIHAHSGISQTDLFESHCQRHGLPVIATLPHSHSDGHAAEDVLLSGHAHGRVHGGAGVNMGEGSGLHRYDMETKRQDAASILTVTDSLATVTATPLRAPLHTHLDSRSHVFSRPSSLSHSFHANATRRSTSSSAYPSSSSYSYPSSISASSSGANSAATSTNNTPLSVATSHAIAFTTSVITHTNANTAMVSASTAVTPMVAHTASTPVHTGATTPATALNNNNNSNNAVPTASVSATPTSAGSTSSGTFTTPASVGAASASAYLPEAISETHSEAMLLDASAPTDGALAGNGVILTGGAMPREGVMLGDVLSTPTPSHDGSLPLAPDTGSSSASASLAFAATAGAAAGSGVGIVGGAPTVPVLMPIPPSRSTSHHDACAHPQSTFSSLRAPAYASSTQTPSLPGASSASQTAPPSSHTPSMASFLARTTSTQRMSASPTLSMADLISSGRTSSNPVLLHAHAATHELTHISHAHSHLHTRNQTQAQTQTEAQTPAQVHTPTHAHAPADMPAHAYLQLQRPTSVPAVPLSRQHQQQQPHPAILNERPTDTSRTIPASPLLPSASFLPPSPRAARSLRAAAAPIGISPVSLLYSGYSSVPGARARTVHSHDGFISEMARGSPAFTGASTSVGVGANIITNVGTSMDASGSVSSSVDAAFTQIANGQAAVSAYNASTVASAASNAVSTTGGVGGVGVSAHVSPDTTRHIPDTTQSSASSVSTSPTLSTRTTASLSLAPQHALIAVETNNGTVVVPIQTYVTHLSSKGVADTAIATHIQRYYVPSPSHPHILVHVNPQEQQARTHTQLQSLSVLQHQQQHQQPQQQSGDAVFGPSRPFSFSLTPSLPSTHLQGRAPVPSASLRRAAPTPPSYSLTPAVAGKQAASATRISPMTLALLGEADAKPTAADGFGSSAQTPVARCLTGSMTIPSAVACGNAGTGMLDTAMTPLVNNHLDAASHYMTASVPSAVAVAPTVPSAVVPAGANIDDQAACMGSAVNTAAMTGNCLAAICTSAPTPPSLMESLPRSAALPDAPTDTVEGQARAAKEARAAREGEVDVEGMRVSDVEETPTPTHTPPHAHTTSTKTRVSTSGRGARGQENAPRKRTAAQMLQQDTQDYLEMHSAYTQAQTHAPSLLSRVHFEVAESSGGPKRRRASKYANKAVEAAVDGVAQSPGESEKAVVNESTSAVGNSGMLTRRMRAGING